MKKATNEEVLFLACLSHWLTVAARGAYIDKSSGITKVDTLCAYNEVQHRLSAAILDRMKGKAGMPIKDVLEMLEILGKNHQEKENIDFFLNEAHRCSQLKKI